MLSPRQLCAPISTLSAPRARLRDRHDFRAPTWPDGSVPMQVHLDFYVSSIADSEPAVLAAGARRHDHQPSPDGRFVVYLDPVGHPFCLCEE